jgi:uncharacterized membrane protein
LSTLKCILVIILLESLNFDKKSFCLILISEIKNEHKSKSALWKSNYSYFSERKAKVCMSYTFHWTFTKACFDSILQILYLLLGEQTNLFKKNKQYFESENQSFKVCMSFKTLQKQKLIKKEKCIFFSKNILRKKYSSC